MNRTKRWQLAAKNTVASVLVTQGETPYLHEAVNSLLNQKVLPDQIFIVDVDDKSNKLDDLVKGVNLAITDNSLPTAIFLIKAPSVSNFADAVYKVVEAPEFNSTVRWLWFLHDDVKIDSNCLYNQLTQVANSQNIVAVGAKQVAYDSNELINVGYTSSVFGKRVTKIGVGEVDQKQYDSREDVLAVSLNGMLVDTKVFITSNGINKILFKTDDSLEFSRRLRLMGYRVIVATDALIKHAQRSYKESKNFSYLTNRSKMIYRLSTVNLFLFLPFWLFLFISAFFSLISQLYKAKSLSWQVLAGSLCGLFSFRSIFYSRRLISVNILSKNLTSFQLNMPKRKIYSRRNLYPLYAKFSQIFMIFHDQSMEKKAKLWDPFSPSLLQTINLKTIRKKRNISLSILVFLLVVLTGVRFFNDFPEIFMGGHFIATDLFSTSASRVELFNASTTYFTDIDFGYKTPTDGYLLILNLLNLPFGNLQLTLNLLILFSLLLSGLSMWVASGAFTRNNSGRICISMFWAACPSFIFILSDGNIGNILAHIILPFFIYLILRSMNIVKTDLNLGQPSFRNHFAACGLFGAFLTVCCPILLFLVVPIFVFVGIKYKRFWFALIPVGVFNIYPILFIVTNLQNGSLRIFLADISTLYSLIFLVFAMFILLLLQQRIQFDTKNIFNYLVYAIVIVLIMSTSSVYSMFLNQNIDKLHATADYQLPSIAQKIEEEKGHPRILVLNSPQIGNVEWTVIGDRSSDLINTSIFQPLISSHDQQVSKSNNANMMEGSIGNILALSDVDNDIQSELISLGIGGIYVQKNDNKNASRDSLISSLDAVNGISRIIEGSDSPFWRVETKTKNQTITWDESSYQSNLNSPFRYLFALLYILSTLVYILLSLPFGVRKVIRYEI